MLNPYSTLKCVSLRENMNTVCQHIIQHFHFCSILQHQLRQLEAQKRQQELILRRKTEEVNDTEGDRAS